MVRRAFFIALTCILCITSTFFLDAAEFSANVNSTQLQLSSNFSLQLILKDSSPKEAPNVSALNDHFFIQSQQHTTHTTIANGKISSSIIWKLSLIPKMEGVQQIPSITIDTADGILSTQPITLNVVKGTSPQSDAESSSLNLITKASTNSPYKNEPFVYTALLTSKIPLYNVQAQKIQVEDAIVELLEQPKLEERVIDGVRLNVVEFRYLITPLKQGPLKITPLMLQGAIAQKRKTQFGSFFNDDLDPFALMQSFGSLKPFTLMTEEIHLDVQPAVAEVSPWLPAKALILEEEWLSKQTLRVGEPVARGFLIKGEGLKASQLPRLEELQSQGSYFKIYADKAEEEEKVFDGSLHSTRKEHYTLIPQQAGTWELPEISISWWDSANKERKTTTIPARTVHILPALETAASGESQIAFAQSTDAVQELPFTSERTPFLLYAVIGVLAFLLAAALLWGCILYRKIADLTKDPSPKPAKLVEPKRALTPAKTVSQKEKKERLPDLNPT